jgi:tRNA uridine 5-carboxymethylaminomethyl modification enzyme
MDFDIIVIGGGHAGIEAALATSRLGFSTLLVTQNPDCIGKMSCNPAIGGLSKGNLVREIDALGGEMGLLIDRSMIQYRVLNRSRGPAVQAPRAQADKLVYMNAARAAVEGQKGLSVFMDTVTDFMLDPSNSRVEGVVTERGRRFTSKAVVLTTGTFMDGKIFIGDFSASSGRLGEPAATGLGSSLRRLGFTVGRLKTGTPARVRRSSLDFSKFEEEEGEDPMEPFSFRDDVVERPGSSCWITFTTEETHAIIRENIGRSPLYSGKIVGRGPRYCPSIEDKVMRFPDRDRHQVFVEPEGLYTDEMYLNGLSSSLPEDVQAAFLRTLPGLEAVEIVRPGYAVEYDFLEPTQLHPSLETKRLSGLFVAGQTNGTSGYEEAAAQGIIAGINAVRKLQGEEPLVLSRAEAYIGVLIDDLVTLGTKEPYRMFTSRAEYRLNLRHDTADRRLLPRALEIGLASQEAAERFAEKTAAIDEIAELLASRKTDAAAAAILPSLAGHVGDSLAQASKDPAVHADEFASAIPELSVYRPDWVREVLIDVKYAGYIVKQDRAIERFSKLEEMRIPAGFDWAGATGLSNEAREKLKAIDPRSVGQAARVSGIRQGDIAVLLMMLTRRRGGDGDR